MSDGKDLLFGIETEYAITTRGSASSDFELDSSDLRDASLAELFKLGARRLQYLPDASSGGFFLANGSRLYIDCGGHPELCTPECRTPEEVVRWSVAGERILVELLGELEKQHPEESAAIFRCNVDYSGSGSTWGCHESYAIRGEPKKVGRHLLAHLVSRIVFAGAGGFDNVDPGGAFLLSPRSPHLGCDVQWRPVSERALIHDRNEPLCRGGYHRLHLMCGETLCSQLATYLKLGATALVVRLAELKRFAETTLELVDPVQALQDFSRDPRLLARARLRDGRRLTAIELQRGYLEHVERHLEEDFMPGWAQQVCIRWREVLDDLERDPASLATRLDWAIKHSLYRERMSGAGRAGTAELFEIDTRFGELGARGIFASLEAAGVLDHRLPELGDVDAAMQEPPPGARPALRGEAIRLLHPHRERYQASWDVIVDTEEPRVMVMDDPFDTEPHWTDGRHRPAVSEASPSLGPGISLYNELRLEEAVPLLERYVASVPETDAEKLVEARFWYACALQDLGRVDDALEALAPALSFTREQISLSTAARVWTRYGLALIERPAPLAQIVEHLEKTEELCASGPPDPHFATSRLGMLRGRLLAVRGRTEEAIDELERAYEASKVDSIQFATTTYLRWLVRLCARAQQWSRGWEFAAILRPPGRQVGLERRLYGVTVESELALREGRAEEAYRLASEERRQLAGRLQHRSHVSACCAFVEAAVAVGRSDEARPFLEEALRWRHRGLAELRFDIRRAYLAYHSAHNAHNARNTHNTHSANGACPSGQAESSSAVARCAERAALREARGLDDCFETDFWQRELDLWREGAWPPVARS